MTRDEREKKARELMDEAGKLRSQAWELLVQDATEEEIQDSVGSMWEQYRDLGMDALDDDGTKAEALLGWREWQRTEEGQLDIQEQKEADDERRNK